MKLIDDIKNNEKFRPFYELIDSRRNFLRDTVTTKVDDFFIGLMKSNADDSVKNFFLDGKLYGTTEYNKFPLNKLVSYVSDFSIFGDKVIDYLENSQLSDDVKAIRYVYYQDKDSKNIPDELLLWIGSFLKGETESDSMRKIRRELCLYLLNNDEEEFKKQLNVVVDFNIKCKSDYHTVPLYLYLCDKRYYDKTYEKDIELAKDLRKYIDLSKKDLKLSHLLLNFDPSFDFILELKKFRFLYDYIDKALYGISWNHWKFANLESKLKEKFPEDHEKYTSLMALPNIFYREGVARQFKKSKYANISKLLKYNKENVLESIHKAYFKDWA